MMIAVQTIRATTRAPAESAMSAWHWTTAPYKAMARPIESAASAYMSSKKRKRDYFESYDFQVHRQQKMRYSLCREQPQDQLHPSPVYRRDSLEQLADHVIVPKWPVPPTNSTEAPVSRRSPKSDNILKTRRRSSKKSKSSTSRRRSVRMTKRHYNKKKRLEMMEVTGRQIRRVLESSHSASLSMKTCEKMRRVRQQAEKLDKSVRDQCNSIVQKEQDIKSWLGMTTSNKSKIVSLRKRLHDRWAEVKDLQGAVKPRRQRLKNLRFAAICVERSIAEE